MTLVVVETPPRYLSRGLPSIRVHRLDRLVKRDGALLCPRCGGSRFTAKVGQDGALILSCWLEPAHIRLPLRPE